MLRILFPLFSAAVLSAAEPAPLGKLSEKYESGGRGPGTVSTGVGDPGGVSYGTYQLASKIGRADEFAKEYFPKEFEGLKGGTDEFTKVWKALAKKDPIGLHAAEHEFIRKTHYEPQFRRLAKLGIDLDKRSAALRDVIWSTAVHHGPNTDVVDRALQSEKLAGQKPARIGDGELIAAIYAERGRTDDTGKLVRFRGVAPEWIPALKKRFIAEEKDARDLLGTESK